MLVPVVVLAFAVVYFGLDTRLNAGLVGDVAKTLVGGLR
jgi:hypothetical protein